MDIGKMIALRPNSTDNGVPKVKIATLFNRKIAITKWEIKKSHFDDGNRLGLFAEISGKCLDNSEEWCTTTSSNVVIDQLQQLDKALAEHPEYPREVECIMKGGKFLKLYSTEEA